MSIVGYCFMMHTGAANATNAAGMEMNAIASAIIGGTLLTGRDSSPAGFFAFSLLLAKIFRYETV